MAKLHDMDVDDYLAQAVGIDPLAIQEEYVRVPAELAYWNCKYAEAVNRHLRAKHHLEVTEAQLRFLCRDALEEAGRKVTESTVDSAMLRHSSYEPARFAAIEAEVEVKRLAGVVDAVRTKRDMLVSLGAHVRAEMQHDPVIRSEQRDAFAVMTEK